MPDERTERERKADAALDDAIREVIAASVEAGHTGDDRPQVLTYWMVVCNHVGQDDDGGFSTTSILHPPGSAPWPQVFGMLHAAQLRLDRDYMTPAE